MRGRTPRVFGFEGQWGLISGTQQDWKKKKKKHFWRVHTSSCAHQDPGERQWLHRSLGQTYLLVLEDLLARWGAAVAHFREKDNGSRSTGEYSLA